MGEFSAGIPDEAREAMMRQPGGPFRSVFRGLVVVAIANLLIDLHAWLQSRFPDAPDYMLRLVVILAFVGAVGVLLWVVSKLFTLWESIADWWDRRR